MAIDRDKVLEAAQAFVEKKRFDKAIVEYQKVLAVDPKDARALLKLGEVQVKAEQYEAAVATFEQTGQVLGTQGFALKAVAAYQQAREVVQRHVPHLTDRFGYLVTRMADLYVQLRRPNDAVSLYEESAARLEAAGRQRDAIDILKKIVELDPQSFERAHRLAEAQMRVGDLEGAGPHLVILAEGLAARGQHDDAINIGERAFTAKPELRVARLLAQLYLDRGLPKDGAAAFVKIQVLYKQAPKDLDTLGLLARALWVLRQPERAVEVHKEAARVASESNRPEVFDFHMETLATRAPHDPGVRKLAAIWSKAPAWMREPTPGPTPEARPPLPPRAMTPVPFAPSHSASAPPMPPHSASAPPLPPHSASAPPLPPHAARPPPPPLPHPRTQTPVTPPQMHAPQPQMHAPQPTPPMRTQTPVTPPQMRAPTPPMRTQTPVTPPQMPAPTSPQRPTPAGPQQGFGPPTPPPRAVPPLPRGAPPPAPSRVAPPQQAAPPLFEMDVEDPLGLGFPQQDVESQTMDHAFVLPTAPAARVPMPVQPMSPVPMRPLIPSPVRPVAPQVPSVPQPPARQPLAPPIPPAAVMVPPDPQSIPTPVPFAAPVYEAPQEPIEPPPPSSFAGRGGFDEDALEEVDFFVSQGMFEDALNLLDEQLARLPNHPLLLDRKQEIQSLAAAAAAGGEADPWGTAG